MKKLIIVSLLAAGIATPALADTSTDSTTVRQDSNGNYASTDSRDRVDANGNRLSVNTNINEDANGNASVTKRVENDATNAYGTNKTVTRRTADTNGNEKVSEYEEHSNQ